jgi:hypothetical protein
MVYYHMTCNCSWDSKSEFVPVDDFLDYVSAGVPHIDAQLVAHNIRVAAIEFARSTRYMVQRVHIDAQAGVPDYHIELPDEYRIYSIAAVDYDGMVLQPDQLSPSGYRGSGIGMSATYPRQRGYNHTFGYSTQTGLMINPPPTQDGERCIGVNAIVIPTQDSCYLPRDLYDKFADIIGAGALAALMRNSQAKWYDLRNAGIYRRQFEQGIRRARDLAMTGGIAQPIKMKAHSYV